ncbi:MAG TPA: hypothetical protein VLD84_05240 [Nitrososphaeraceae archaeon]|nr:hypothetical protein [Nitrososphaeraceae archaeon]
MTKKKILAIFALKHYIEKLNKIEQEKDIVLFGEHLKSDFY